MIEPAGARQVKLLAAVLWRTEEALTATRKAMANVWGPIDHEGADHPFTTTDYYTSEMGPDLKRRLFSFRRIISPETIVPLKHEACAIENDLAVDNRRQVNIDVGYLDVNKLVLASLKYGPQKIYLGSRVWADLISFYRKGHFRTMEWSFADFKDNRYERELLLIRERYKQELREETT